MESCFIVNVSKFSKGSWFHFFRVQISGHSAEYCNVGEVVKDLRDRFSSKAYKIEVTQWKCEGHRVEGL